MRRSQRRKLLDWLGIAARQTPYRCQECRRRFYEGGWQTEVMGAKRSGGGFARWKRKQGPRIARLAVILLLVAGAVMAFFAFLTRPPAP